ncbi:LytTR family DNA-binding domain-containing protein [Lacibacter sp.]|uniref:LytR/AlgR family response regulator transcription factor n=1 Tax=Lacibacter sp. TaxID=1915409 RepID=UPI002B4B1FB4|nr:LytTR family DNA-binding domain-containing protein [Lacibacter sp.]HLP38817.1 LytTR family DNA-binding domain-containing protein [Lacibacter sp.]
MLIKVVIIDDEPLARKGLKEYVADVDFLQLVGEFDHPLKAADLISKGEVQLLLLDIQMPKITGIDFFKSLQQAPPVIFTTAYPQYALDGFELNALDYLVKPISFDRFLKAAMKAKDYYELRQQNKAAETAEQHTDFYIKADNRFVRISFNEIQYVEALQNYVCIYTNEKKYISYLTMKSVEEYLPASQFIKTHKSFIVNAAKIEAIDGNEIRIGEHRIPISRNEKEDVLEQLLKNKFLKR